MTFFKHVPNFSCRTGSGRILGKDTSGRTVILSPNTSQCVRFWLSTRLTCMCVCVHIYIYIHTYIYIYIHTHTHIYIYIHIYIHTHIYIYIYIHIYIHIYTHTHTHTHTHIAILGKMQHILENVSVFATLEFTKVAYWSGITLVNLVFRYINFKRKEKIHS